MPLGLGNLTHRQTLDWFVVRGQSSSSINPNSSNGCNQSDTTDDHVGGLADLNCLNSLKAKLTILVEGCWSSVSEAMAVNLEAREHLTELCIIFVAGSRERISISATEAHRYVGYPGRLPHLKFLEIETSLNWDIIEDTATMGSSNDSMKADEANANPGPENNANTPSAPLRGAQERANAFP